MSYNSIIFGVVDSAAIEAQITAQYIALTGRTPVPSDPEFAVNATIAYARLLRLQDAERALKSVLPSFATGANLDYIFELVGGERSLSTPSVTRVQLALDPARGPLVIPGGFLVSSTDGIAVYATNENFTPPYDPAHAGAQPINTVIVDATCTDDGAFSNGYAVGTITTIQNPTAYINSATNLDLTSGGADVETDESIRSRWIPTLKALSKGGPLEGYEGLALGADPTIVSVKVLGPETLLRPAVNPGSVEVRVLTDTGAPTTSILNLVYSACSAKTERPMTDKVIVLAAARRDYSLNLGFRVVENSPAALNIPAATAAVLVAVSTYTRLQSLTIGRDIKLDKIVEIAMAAMDGIFDIDENGFTDIVIDDRTFGYCTSLTVTNTGISPA
jgi:phage-related baseplate assembly protein